MTVQERTLVYISSIASSRPSSGPHFGLPQTLLDEGTLKLRWVDQDRKFESLQRPSGS
jgi:hypothetical protein